MTAVAPADVGFLPVETAEQAERVRLIRNEARALLFDQREITAEGQRAWWAKARTAVRLRLVTRGAEEVGYVLLRPREGGGQWVTLVVVPAHRGQGVGRSIYGAAPALCGGERVYAAMWAYNVASRRAAEAAGYREVPALAGAETLVLASREAKG